MKTHSSFIQFPPNPLTTSDLPQRLYVLNHTLGFEVEEEFQGGEMARGRVRECVIIKIDDVPR